MARATWAGDWKAADVAVVGAGIIGSALAWFLARLGLRVAVLDSSGGPAGASAATHSIISMHSRMPGPLLDLGYEALEMYAGFRQQFGCDIGFQQGGALLLVADPAHMPALSERVRVQQQAGLAIELLNPAELRHLDATVAPDLAGGAFCPASATFYSPGSCLGFQAAAARLGAQFYHHAPVTGIEVAGGRVVAVRSRDRRLPAGCVVNAAGAAAGEVAAMAGVSLLLRLNRGHILISERTRPMGVAIKAEFPPPDPAGSGGDAEERLWSVRFVFARSATGHVFLGRSGEWHVTDRMANLRAVRAIISRAHRYLPQVSQVNILRIMTGQRPYTVDRLPVVGPVPYPAGYFQAVGFGDAGVTASMAARHLAAWIATGLPQPTLAPFRWDRPSLRKEPARE